MHMEVAVLLCQGENRLEESAGGVLFGEYRYVKASEGRRIRKD